LQYTFSPPQTTLRKPDPKAKTLKQLGMLNAHPERVAAPWFPASAFFDPRDLVQVKYEMLRHISVEGASKAKTAALFGVSRPTVYQAQAAFARAGLAGLLPQRRGPKQGHKLDAQVIAFAQARLSEDATLRARELVALIEAELGGRVHPRSIERALARKKKRQAARR
jgi:transposase